jgi:hypothetical protein
MLVAVAAELTLAALRVLAVLVVVVMAQPIARRVLEQQILVVVAVLPMRLARRAQAVQVWLFFQSQQLVTPA